MRQVTNERIRDTDLTVNDFDQVMHLIEQDLHLAGIDFNDQTVNTGFWLRKIDFTCCR